MAWTLLASESSSIPIRSTGITQRISTFNNAPILNKIISLTCRADNLLTFICGEIEVVARVAGYVLASFGCLVIELSLCADWF